MTSSEQPAGATATALAVEPAGDDRVPGVAGDQQQPVRRRDRRRQAEPFGAAVLDHRELELVRRIVIWMLLGGAAVSVVGMLLTPSWERQTFVQGAVALVFAVLALGLAVVREPTGWLLELNGVWGIILTGVIIATVEPVGMTPVYLLWPVVLIAWFSSARVLVAVFALMVTTLSLALWQNPSAGGAVDTFIATVSTVGLVAGLVALLTRQHARLRAELAHAAETDPLTGLLNRRAFAPRVEALVAQAVAQNRQLSLVMLDLDHFKQVNDEHGHHVGDEVLTRLGAVLTTTSRDGDLVARLGGEEFVVALPGAGSAEALVYAARVARALRSARAGEVATPSASAGICSLTPDVEPVDVLLRRADTAMYAAKAAGRNRPAVWADPIDVGEPFGETQA